MVTMTGALLLKTDRSGLQVFWSLEIKTQYKNTLILKHFDTLLGVGTLGWGSSSAIFISPSSQVGVISYRKEFAPLGENSFL